MQYIVPLPLSIYLDKKQCRTKYSISINNYRGVNVYKLNKAKHQFDTQVAPLLVNLPVFRKIKISYFLYKSSNRRSDLDNLCYIVAKFFHDTLRVTGHLVDDNTSIIVQTNFIFAGIDKDHPRLEAIIEEV